MCRDITFSPGTGQAVHSELCLEHRGTHRREREQKPPPAKLLIARRLSTGEVGHNGQAFALTVCTSVSGQPPMRDSTEQDFTGEKGGHVEKPHMKCKIGNTDSAFEGQPRKRKFESIISLLSRVI